ncbi:unnamed protein product, partial [Polarella glacialis]
MEPGQEVLPVETASPYEPIPALLLPRREVGTALKALNSMRPRWGELVLQAARGGRTISASRKGVHTPDPTDDSSLALRAIELPSPLDRQVAEAARAMDHDDVHGAEAASATAVPAELLALLAQGAAVFDPAFRPPCELDDLQPCPDLDPILAEASKQPLPAQERGKTSAAAAGEWLRIGGFRLGLEALGGQCVFASELHPTARAVYQENWPGESERGVLAGDIRLVPADEVPEHELLTAGFPCQPFSALGEQQGLAESRGLLFLHICRLLRTKRPPLALLENVPGLLETDEGRALQAVLDELRASGYRVAYRVYNSQSLLPQKRKRVYIVCIRSDLQAACDSFRFPWLP